MDIIISLLAEKALNVLVNKSMNEKEKNEYMINIVVDSIFDIIRKSISCTKMDCFDEPSFISKNEEDISIGFILYLNSDFNLLDDLRQELAKISVKFNFDTETDYNLNSLLRNIRIFLIDIRNLKNNSKCDDEIYDNGNYLLNTVIDDLYKIVSQTLSITNKTLNEDEIYKKTNILLERLDLDIENKYFIAKNEIFNNKN